MQPFQPQKLPINTLNWEKLAILIGKANANLSLYSGLLEAIINPHILLSPITTQEAILSSRIEGTQASLTEVLEFDAGENTNNPEKNNDLDEIMNYRKAMIKAEVLFKDKPFIHLNMLKELHFILLSGVRGENKSRGNFRIIQNYIGSYGTTIEEATFVPPAPNLILPALDNWEKYINSETQETLVQLACLHAQFEIIHPFLDGNGRMGRILIPLYLYQKKLLNKPVFYLSEYFEENRGTYYNKLQDISLKNDWQGWIEFFLNAIIEQSTKNMTKARNILDLYEKSKKEFINTTHSQFAIKLLDTFFIKPIVSSSQALKISGITNAFTITNLLKKLEKTGQIRMLKKGKGSSPNIYAFPKLINLTEGRKIIEE